MVMCWPAAPTAMATAALNRNRNQSTGLRLSRADMMFFLPGRGAVNGADWGLAGVSGVRAVMTFFLRVSGWGGAGWGQMPACAAAAPVPFLVIRAMPAPANATGAPTRKA